MGPLSTLGNSEKSPQVDIAKNGAEAFTKVSMALFDVAIINAVSPFFLFYTFYTGLGWPLSLELSDAKVYAP